MPALSSDYFQEVGNPGTATVLQAPGHTIGGTTFNVTSTANWPTTTGVTFAVDQYDVGTGLRVPGTYTEWSGVVTSSTTIASAVLRVGTDQNFSAGSTTRVYIPVSSGRENRLAQGLLVSHEQTGALKTTAVQTALGLGTGALNGWNPLANTANTVVYNGNRSYTCTFNSVDLTATLSAGMRFRSQRTVAAPTQSTSLNGTTQYWSKTSPAGMTFTDDFTVSAWVKVSSYASGVIIARGAAGGTTGIWQMFMNTSGQIIIQGSSNGSLAGSSRTYTTYQSVPLNKWVHLAATLDMSGASGVTYMDGVSVPNTLSAGHTGTALAQAGNFFVGSNADGNFFPGKIAQAAVFSSVLSAATIQSYYSQGLSGTEPTLVSAYSFNGNANDLNTTNANNLTSNNGATATNADSPFGGQADGTISSTLDYGIFQKVNFIGGNTVAVVQMAEGCTIPTSGGVTAAAYSSQRTPYLFPSEKNKWRLISIYYEDRTFAISSASLSYFAFPGLAITGPLGRWKLKLQANLLTGGSTGASQNARVAITTENVAVGGASASGNLVLLETLGRYGIANSTTIDMQFDVNKQTYVEPTVETTYKTLVRVETAGGGFTTRHIGISQGSISFMSLENAYL